MPSAQLLGRLSRQAKSDKVCPTATTCHRCHSHQAPPSATEHLNPFTLAEDFGAKKGGSKENIWTTVQRGKRTSTARHNCKTASRHAKIEKLKNKKPSRYAVRQIPSYYTLFQAKNVLSLHVTWSQNGLKSAGLCAACISHPTFCPLRNRELAVTKSAPIA